MRFSSLVLLGAATTVLSTSAFADVFYSSATGSTPGSSATFYGGYSATAPTAPPSTATGATYDIGTGGIWAGPIGPSSWVPFDPNSYPGGSSQPANGYYDYKVSLSNIAGETSLTVLADDTTSVWLNGSTQLIPEGSGPYPQCAVGQPNCVSAYTFNFYADANAVLDFEVHQAANYSTGLDFYGVSTPEPGSLMLLGSGLLTGAGTLLRRLRRA